MRLIWLCLCLGFPAPASAGDDDFGGLPPGPGRERVFAICDACHSIKLVTQQGLSHDVWNDTLDYMIEEQGMAALEAAERALILDYLAKNFGADLKQP